MKLNVTYEIRGEYLYVKAMGEFDPITAKDVFFEWTEKARSNNLNRVLCDITLVTGLDAESTSMVSRFETSEFVARSLSRGLRLAVLETPEQLTKDGFDENVMVNRGAMVKVTSDLQEALKWLGVISANKTDAG